MGWTEAFRIEAGKKRTGHITHQQKKPQQKKTTPAAGKKKVRKRTQGK